MAKSKNVVLARCMDCKFSELMRNGSNPIIAVCSIKNERYVASAITNCNSYVKTVDKKEIGVFRRC